MSVFSNLHILLQRGNSPTEKHINAYRLRATASMNYSHNSRYPFIMFIIKLHDEDSTLTHAVR